MEWKTQHQNVWDAEKAVLRQKFIAKKAYILKRKISNKQPNFTPQGTRKKQSPK